MRYIVSFDAAVVEAAPNYTFTVLALDQRVGKHRIELVHQVPRALVGHVHGFRGLGDRAMLADQLKKLDAPVADVALFVEVYPKLDLSH